jgi:DNA-binding beta-propeller fold protein YncE
MGRKSYKIVGLVGVLFTCLMACKKDNPATPTPIPTPTVSGNVYIVCEGSLGNIPAALSLYQPIKDSSYSDIYKSTNNQLLGDIFQSMQPIGNYYFLCVNNSNKIVVIRKDNWLLVSTIAITQPRYILPVNDTKAYISSLFNNKVYIINPQSFSLIDSIIMPAQNAEGMLLYNNTAYITTWDTATHNIYAINTFTNQITQSIQVAGVAPKEVLIDKDNRLWVLSGNIQQGKGAAFSKVNPDNGQVIKSYTFPIGADPMRAVMNTTKDTIYFIEVNYNGGTQNNGIYRMSIYDNNLPTQPFITAGTYQYYWALGIEPHTGNLYVGDPKGFTQKGSVYIYNTNASLLKQFSVAVGPGHFYFDE